MKNGTLLMILGGLLLVFAYKEMNKVVVVNNYTYNIEIKQESRDTLSLQSVRDLIESCNIEHPDIVMQQVKLESGHLTSNLSKNNNNIFGMTHPAKRQTTSMGEKNNFANYNNWRESIFDYALWQSRYASGLTEDEYYQLLGRVYATDSTYIFKLKNVGK